MKYKIGIRPVIDGRMGGVRESIEDKTMEMALLSKKLIEENLTYSDGSSVECIINSSTIGGIVESNACDAYFSVNNVIATLTVTPVFSYGTETMDLNPQTIKAVWGYNGTECPGAVYLACAMSGYAERGLPAFSIYGKDVQNLDDKEIPEDVKKKILVFCEAAIAIGEMKNKSYLSIGGVSMGISGSFLDPNILQDYLGMHSEWIDMIEIQRRIVNKIYDEEEYQFARKWVKKNCIIGIDYNKENLIRSEEQKELDWEYSIKMALIIQDLMIGNPKLKEMGYSEEHFGWDAIVAGFQGQRQWTDFLTNADFAESILNSSFNWHGKKQPNILATENDTLNGISMLFENLLGKTACIFADMRTYWSPEALKKHFNYEPQGKDKNGFIHLCNSGAAALDGAAETKLDGKSLMKKWWEISDDDILKTMKKVEWCPANNGYFRNGGYSCHYVTRVEMPLTMIRLNRVKGIGLAIQVVEGYSINLPKEVSDAIEQRTDPGWPSTFFSPILNGIGIFTNTHRVMENWGANHSSFTYGHIGDKLITMASMLRIPVTMHNIEPSRIFRPQVWNAFGPSEEVSTDLQACKNFGPMYR